MVLIAVHGSASRLLPAERGTVRLAIEVEDPDRATVVQRVGALHARFVGEAEALVAAGAATRWSSGQVSVRAEQRYEGREEARRVLQVAAAEVLIRFQDLEALSSWVLEAGAESGAAIERIEWAVTEEHRVEAERALRVEAVRDAVARAEAYASAVGGSAVVLQAVWEEGLRPGVVGGGGRGGWDAQAMSKGAGPGIELRPEDIGIEASVTADFAVDLPG